MEREINQKRILYMRQMLLEMAGGNFTSRIPRTTQDDEMETLVVLVNMVAEEMEESLFHSGYINPHHSNRHLTHATFILNDSFIIKSYNSEASTILGYSDESLRGKNFMSLLSDESIVNLNTLKETLYTTDNQHKSIPLTYITKDQKTIASSFCSISRLLHNNKIVVNSIIPILQESFVLESIEKTSERLPKTRRADAQLIQKVYDYVLANLETPLPSLKELSRIFGTNEYKLKEGFRHFFNTSIYQFYNDERLKRIHLIIQQTNIPLKNIAYMNGFNTYPNFSKAFKKRYGYSPNELKRG